MLTAKTIALRLVLNALVCLLCTPNLVLSVVERGISIGTRPAVSPGYWIQGRELP